MAGSIHAFTMSSGFPDAQDFRASTICECGQEMHKGSTMCITCWNKKHNAKMAAEKAQAQRDSMMDRHTRITAMLEAGWTFEEMVAELPRVQTWEQISERDPSVVIKYRPDVVIRAWWEKQEPLEYRKVSEERV